MAYYLSEINERCKKDPAAFIADCDALYAARLEQAADRIIENRARSPIVLLSGPSGSGKTTTSMKIAEVLERKGVRTHYIAMDDYFLDVSPETTPRLPDGGYDLESPLCMDMDLLNEHFSMLSRGQRILVPKFEFARQMRVEYYGRPLQLREDEIAVFEGIHALNDAITDVHPEAFKLYISARSNVVDDEDRVVFKGTWMRLMRRTVRDYLFRGTRADVTLKRWASVRRGEKLYISPFKDKADLQFDSSFAYEVPALNHIAEELFTSMPEDTPRYQELRSILPAFERFEDISTDLLAEDSLLREFVGG
ncbi:MAG: nucleoside kinase, partial [Oscillospiraceae bacterium]|nr:nucleoside kinase [Oscillospiraceae bacterium]